MQSTANSSLVDVNFVPARPYFVVGDCIQGNMILSSTASGVVIGGVQAEVTCTADAFWVFYSNGGRDSRSFYHPTQYTHKYSLASPSLVLNARPSGGVALTSSVTHPIGIPIPFKEEMPSTMAERQAICPQFKRRNDRRPMSVIYGLKLTVFDMVCAIMLEKTFAVDIRAVYVYPNPERPLKVYHTVVTASCCSSNILTFYCVTDRTVYGPGDRMRLSYWYDTKSPSNMPKIVSVSVTLSLIANSLSQPMHYPMESTVMLLETSCTVPTTDGVSHVTVDVPTSIVPDFNQAVAPHPISYKNVFLIVLGVGGRTVWLPMPVMFNSLSSHHLAQFPYPVLQKPLPPSSVQAQAFYVSQPNPPGLTASSASPAVPSGVSASSGGHYFVPGTASAAPIAPMGVPAASGGPYFMSSVAVAPSPYIPSYGVAVAPSPGPVQMMYYSGA